MCCEIKRFALSVTCGRPHFRTNTKKSATKKSALTVPLQRRKINQIKTHIASGKINLVPNPGISPPSLNQNQFIRVQRFPSHPSIPFHPTYRFERSKPLYDGLKQIKAGPLDESVCEWMKVD